MMQQTTATDRPSQLPTEIGSAQGKLVYLTLEVTGEATVTDLNRTLNMRKISILSVLSSLSSQGLIERTDAGYALAS
ncbi:helix-turn-helix domain-containing protein [Natrinema marinum]|uniref:helix-turn-helix domain-containing protein n=1 Tax=Natrinema marinum TaxID=2961598 RepID=UPI0020C8FFFE|nr:helix-turn-helix domain-containing protein [Natrinema marinum]